MRRLGIVAALAAALVVGCSREAERPPADRYVYAPVRTAAAYVALVEKPDATRALLLGEEARRLAPTFAHAGVKTSTTRGGTFDLVVVACEEMTPASCAKAAENLSENGVFVWLMDVKDVTVGQFGRRIKSFAMEGVHLWMPGADRWVLAGRRTPRAIKLSAMLDVFAREGAFADQAAAKCGTLPDVFANYVGERADVMPAFALLDFSAVVRPQNFLTRAVKTVGWISAEGMDADIAAGVLAEVRSMQVVRRIVLEGDILADAATDKAGEDRATETWARAALRNPNDLLLCERVDRLERNARGFLEVGRVIQAMKCFETVVLVYPNDPTAIHNFGMCLKKIGKLDLAEKTLARARKLAAREEN